ncbi:MAG: ATP-binding protein [Magnetospirillum sp.]|nr:ATP-binding protein [Magnetospirillum sp.]
MAPIQTTLGESLLQDFTLHDSQHSFRVTERMREVIPAAVVLTAEELGLLLLAAYLHDIGMHPPGNLWAALRSPDLAGLDEDEARRLKTWLGDFADEVALPLDDHLAAQFCRHRHTDWSAAWIDRHLATLPRPHASWLSDLKALCRSHHWGRSELDGLIATPTVNLRYLAVVLRVADVLDVDPKRVPAILYEHRRIAPGSRLYWQKDLDATLTVTRTGRAVPEVLFTGWPKRAAIHHALDQTAEQIGAELFLARMLADESWFGTGLNPADAGRYAWDLPATVHARIEPLDKAYVPIHGSFRPDTAKLLQLLSGLELYGNPLAAVRELIQNAFDAVRRCIAEDLLKQKARNPAFDAAAHRLEYGARYLVRLTLERAVDADSGATRWWLSCADDGIGMNRAVIENRLLVSGTGRRHAERDLDERCAAAGFAAEVTGQFGIGVLSYFMLADRVEIRTRPQSEPTGWRFTTDGIGAVGELRSDSAAEPGTILRLRLTQAVVGDDAAKWFAALEAYVRETLIRIPCTFALATDGEAPVIDWRPGWTRDGADYTGRVAENIGYGSDERHNAARRESIQWQDAADGVLADGLGYWRVLVPTFLTPFGPGLVVPFADETGSRLLTANSAEVAAWKGMAAEMSFYAAGISSIIICSVMEIDLVSPRAATPAIHRSSLRVAEPGEDAVTVARVRAGDRLGAVAARLAATPLGEASLSLVANLGRRTTPPCATALWIDDDGTLQPVTFPALVPLSRHRSGLPGFRILPLWTAGADVLAWGAGTVPSRIVATADNHLAVLFEHRPTTLAAGPVRCPFPPERPDLVGVAAPGDTTYLNQDHPLVQAVTDGAWTHAMRHVVSHQALRTNPDLAAAWLLTRLLGITPEEWTTLYRQDPAIAAAIFARGGGRRLEAYLWQFSAFYKRVLTADGVTDEHR